MSDRDVETTLQRFRWRMLSQYVTPWELEQTLPQIERWDQWCAVFSEGARGHVTTADHALDAGHLRTAGDTYIRAALWYHWATFLFGHDQDQFVAGMEAMNECWAKAAPLVDPSMELFSVDFESAVLPGYLLRPKDVDRPPLVLLVPGGDSTKEELYSFALSIVERGMAVAAFDGPGQGLVSLNLKMRPDYEVPISAVVDHLLQRDDINGERLAVGGISYGGLFACRAAAYDPRVNAAVSVSSWYTPAGRYPTIDRVSQVALRQYMGDDPAAMMDSITMADAAELINVPLLQVYGGLDKASPPEHAYRVEAEVAGPTTTVVYPDGVHVCNNLYPIVRPMIADWLADQLT